MKGAQHMEAHIMRSPQGRSLQKRGDGSPYSSLPQAAGLTHIWAFSQMNLETWVNPVHKTLLVFASLFLFHYLLTLFVTSQHKSVSL